MLQALVRCFKPEIILETGTYLGVAARLLSEACTRNGFGKVITLELDKDRAYKAKRALADLSNVAVIQFDALEYLRIYNGSPFGLVFLDSETFLRTSELKLLKDRKLVYGPVMVHDTSRLRKETFPDCPSYPTDLDALNLGGIECPYSRGWRLFQF